jgi:hypothetical protein
MSKLADITIIFTCMLILATLIFRVTPLSIYVVGESFGLALIAGISISASIALCVKAEYSLSSGDLKGSLVSLAVFGFLFFSLDFLFNMQNIFNDSEPKKTALIYLLVTFPALWILILDLRGKKWFST